MSFSLDPVILDPSSSHICVSGDLVCVSDSVCRFYSLNPLQDSSKRLVLGSQAQNADFNCWDIEVGDSKHWALGVCQRSASERNNIRFHTDLLYQNGFWGLSRDGNSFHVCGARETSSQLRRPLKAVRVKLIRCSDHPYWSLKFLDASDESVIACIDQVPFGGNLVPFLIPGERNAPLRIVPLNVNMTMENKFSFLERHMEMIPLFGIGFFVVILVLLLMIMLGKMN